MKMYTSTKTGVNAMMISENETEVVLQLVTGEVKTITPSTLKRWWKKTDVAVAVEDTTAEEAVNEAVAEAAEEELANEQAEPEAPLNAAAEPQTAPTAALEYSGFDVVDGFLVSGETKIAKLSKDGILLRPADAAKVGYELEAKKYNHPYKVKVIVTEANLAETLERIKNI